MNDSIDGENVATPNDLKLSDRGGWRECCAVGLLGAALVTAVAVRCSAWLGVAVIGKERAARIMAYASFLGCLEGREPHMDDAVRNREDNKRRARRFALRHWKMYAPEVMEYLQRGNECADTNQEPARSPEDSPEVESRSL